MDLTCGEVCFLARSASGQRCGMSHELEFWASDVPNASRTHRLLCSGSRSLALPGVFSLSFALKGQGKRAALQLVFKTKVKPWRSNRGGGASPRNTLWRATSPQAARIPVSFANPPGSRLHLGPGPIRPLEALLAPWWPLHAPKPGLPSSFRAHPPRRLHSTPSLSHPLAPYLSNHCPNAY